MRTQTKKWIILGICAAALVAWGVLMVVIFRGNDDPGKDEPTSAGPVPEGCVRVWCRSGWTEYEGSTKTAWTTYGYDDYGRCVSVRYKGKWWTQEKTIEYDEATHLTKSVSVCCEDKESVSRTIDIYDNTGEQRERWEYVWESVGDWKAGNEPILLWHYAYDEAGNFTEERYEEDGSPSQFRRETRDTYGHPILCEVKYGDSEWTSVYVAELIDDEGRVVSYFHIDEEGEQDHKYEIVYYADGSHIERDYPVRDPEKVSIKEYDANGGLISISGDSGWGGLPLEGPLTIVDYTTYEYKEYVDKATGYRVQRRISHGMFEGDVIEYYYDKDDRLVEVREYGDMRDYITTTKYTYIPIDIPEEKAKYRDDFYDPLNMRGTDETVYCD